jgi:hypothetical protein
MTMTCEYGFRARRFAAPRNDAGINEASMPDMELRNGAGEFEWSE